MAESARLYGGRVAARGTAAGAAFAGCAGAVAAPSRRGSGHSSTTGCASSCGTVSLSSSPTANIPPIVLPGYIVEAEDSLPARPASARAAACAGAASGCVSSGNHPCSGSGAATTSMSVAQTLAALVVMAREQHRFNINPQYMTEVQKAMVPTWRRQVIAWLLEVRRHCCFGHVEEIACSPALPDITRFQRAPHVAHAMARD